MSNILEKRIERIENALASSFSFAVIAACTAWVHEQYGMTKHEIQAKYNVNVFDHVHALVHKHGNACLGI